MYHVLNRGVDPTGLNPGQPCDPLDVHDESNRVLAFQVLAAFHNSMNTKTRPGKVRSHITPTWLGMTLLAAEVFLCLSDRYRWFAFNGYKGWTAIIAAGLAGAVA